MTLSDQQLMEIANGKPMASSFTDEDLIRIAGNKPSEAKPTTTQAPMTPISALYNRDIMGAVVGQPQPASSTNVPLPSEDLMVAEKYKGSGLPTISAIPEERSLGEGLNALGAGIAAGALAPITGDPMQVGSDNPSSVFDKWVGGAREDNSGAFEVGAYGGDVGAFAASQAIGGAILKPVAGAVGKLPALLQKGVTGATTGAVYGASKEAGKAINDQEVDLTNIAKDAALFGAGDIAIGALGKALGDVGGSTATKAITEKPPVDTQIKNAASSVELGATGVTPEAVKDLATNVVKGLEAIDNKVPNTLRRVSERVESNEAKEIISDGLNVEEVASTKYAGKPLEELNKLGFFSKSPQWLRKLTGRTVTDWDTFADRLRNNVHDPVTDKVRSIMDGIRERAKELGKDVGYIKGYFPQKIGHSYEQAMRRDFQVIISDLQKGIEGIPDKAYESVLKNATQETKDLISEIKAKGNFGATKEAIDAGIAEVVPGSITSSRYMRKRPYTLDTKFTENNARIVIPDYINSMSRSLAMAEKWGANGEKLAAKMVTLQENSPKDFAVVRDVIDAYTGRYQAARAIPEAAEKVVSAHRAVFLTPKLFTATIPNIFQTTLNSMERFGVGSTVKAWARIVLPSVRSNLRASGVGEQDVLLSLLGHESVGVGKVFTEATLSATGFRGINRANLYASALAAEDAIKGWMKLANSGKETVRTGWAKNNLKRLGIDPSKEITPEIMSQKMFRASQDSQLMKSVFSDPLYMSNPRVSAALALKTFGLRMWTSQKDILLKDAVIKNAQGQVTGYNVRPVLQLAASGVMGGYAAIWAKSKLYEQANGVVRRWDKEDKLALSTLIDKFTQAGAFGIALDAANTFWDAVGQRPSDSVDKGAKVAMRLGPVIVSDFVNALGTAINFGSYWSKYGSVTAAARKVAPAVGTLFGSLGQAVGIRVLTPAQKKAKVISMRSREAGEIGDLILAGDMKNAINRIGMWNEHYPTTPILWGEGDDDSPALFINVNTLMRKKGNEIKTLIDAGAY